MRRNLGIKELASLADVSIGTVDRVLHNRVGVSQKTKDKVLQIIKETGYKKNIMASRLKLASSSVIKIAILIPKSQHHESYWNLPCAGINVAVEELEEIGIEAHYFYFNIFHPESFANHIPKILDQDFGAIITVPFFEEESNQLVDLAKGKNIPVVFLDSERRLKIKSNFISQNSFTAGMVAGRLLHGLLGSEGIYVVVNILNKGGKKINNDQREKGFKSFLEKNLKNSKTQFHIINHPLSDGFEFSDEIEKLFMIKQRVGIFVTNARSHLLADLLKDKGIDHASIVGFDLNNKNLAYLKSGDIDFLINQKPEYQGYTAVKAIYKYLTEHDNSQLNIDIPIEIVVKENADYHMSNVFGR